MEKTGGYYEQNPERREISRDRLRWLVDEYCHSSQAEFAQKTGLQRSTVSMYITGKNVLGIRNAAKIGRVFNVNRDWLRGDPDAPMPRDSYIPREFPSESEYIFVAKNVQTPVETDDLQQSENRKENRLIGYQLFLEVLDAYIHSDPKTQWAVEKLLGIRTESDEEDPTNL